MKLRTGQSLASVVDPTTVMVIKAPAAEVTVTCGGPEMVEAGSGGDRHAPDPAQQDGTQMGKRYADDDLGIELLCTKPGTGTLAVDGTQLPLKDAKPLPSSD